MTQVTQIVPSKADEYSLPPWAEDMKCIFDDKRQMFDGEIVKEFDDLMLAIHGHMIRVDNLMERADEILKEHLGTKYNEF